MSGGGKTLESMSDDLWRGITSTRDPEHHPFAILNRIEEIAAGVAFYKGFSNITAVRTDDGCVLIDTGSYHPKAQRRSFECIRSWTPDRIHTAVYTHGHVDHAYGLPPFIEEAEASGAGAPRIVAHEAVRRRMDRYIETAGYNSIINTRQFGQENVWPTEPIYPTHEFADAYSFVAGGTQFDLYHAKGETDDHAWVFLPQHRILCTGDLFIWASPNAGNPQKVQRYIPEWARALRRMAALSPEVLLPGHGLPVYGADRVAGALQNTAAYLESLYAQTLALLNAGESIYNIIHAARPPKDLADKPYLQPIYDEPEFVVRNIHRCLGGWYSGVPSELKPAARSAQAREIAALAGGAGKLVERALALMAAGELALACHLIDWAAEAEPNSRETHAARAQIYRARADAEASTMSRGIFAAVASDSEVLSGPNTPRT